VEVVRHQAIRQHVDEMTFASVLDQLQESSEVRRRVEDGLAIVGSIQNVIANAPDGGTRSSRHRVKLSSTATARQARFSEGGLERQREFGVELGAQIGVEVAGPKS
jgi:hypothetical protein